MGANTTQAAPQVVTLYEFVLIRTYRYLRIGIVGLVLFLASSLLIEIVKSGNLLDSISLYYYTPVHSVFVASLCGVGVALIVYRGYSDTEDVILNAAGFLVFVVALVPTKQSAKDLLNATSVLPVAHSTVLANLGALLIVTLASMITTLCLMIRHRPSGELSESNRTDRRRALAAFGVLAVGYVVVVAIFFWGHSFLFVRGHWTAAVCFFAAIVIAVGINAVRLARHNYPGQARSWLRLLNRYGVIFVAMVADAVAFFVFGEYGLNILPHWIFWLEASLILLFALFWIAQTVEHWGDSLIAESSIANGPPQGPSAGSGSAPSPDSARSEDATADSIAESSTDEPPNGR